jgi:AraC-like DNA-binding protein
MIAVAKSLSTTSVRLVWPFLALARHHGHDTSDVAERLGLTPAQLEDPDARVPQHLAAALLNTAIERTGERDIGLLAARWAESANFGEFATRPRPPFQGTVEESSRWLPLLGEGVRHSIERVGSHVIVRFWFSPELAIHEAAYEYALAVAVLRARRIAANETLAPLSVHFTHTRPASTERHEQLFRCPVHFGAEVTHVVLSDAWFELRNPGVESLQAPRLELATHQMREQESRRDDLASRVLALLGGGEIELRGASAERVARRLGMSVRTLSRKLDAEATSYRALVDDVRKTAALHELTHDARSIAEIADRLGFASSQSFHRAFKRWTGTTADRTRRSARQSARN